MYITPTVLPRRRLVRAQRREVLHRRFAHALLERGTRQLGPRRRAVRQGLDRMLPRVPGPRAARDHPDKFIVNTRFDPRDGDAGLDELKRNIDTYGCKGLKLYTAEWNNGSRGYKLREPAAYPVLEKAQDWGV